MFLKVKNDFVIDVDDPDHSFHAFVVYHGGSIKSNPRRLLINGVFHDC